MDRGRLRLYLGAASGVGTTYAMLDEALRRKNRGTDVMIGWVDAHQRPFTAALLQELIGVERAPQFLDVDAIIARQPDVVIVDELGRRNGSPDNNTCHWEDVERLLDSGISVVATLTVQHIASLAPEIERIIGHAPSGAIPERFLQRAEQIELVDITPEAIRRRIAHGNVFTPTELQPSSAELFNSEAFAQLRSLMMTWLAERLRQQLPNTASRERIVVLLEGTQDDELLARAHRTAQQTGADILALHVARPTDEIHPDQRLARKKKVEDVGGVFHEVIGTDVPSSLLAFADAEHATHIITGSASQRRDGMRRPVADVILPESGISVQRRWWGFAVGAILLALLTLVLVANRDALSVPTSLALYLLSVVTITAIGGRWPGFVSAVVAPLLANWFLIPPYHTFRINDAENILELLVFVSAATIVSAFVAIASRRARDADAAWREATTLASLSQANATDPIEGIITLLMDSFRLTGASVIDNSSMTVIAAAGNNAPTDVRAADFTSDITPTISLAINGPALTANDHRVLSAFVGQLARALQERALRDKATEAEALTKADELRTAILRAVSHDLRSPLASIKASVSSLRQPDIDWPDDVRDDFLLAIENDTDRLTSIITNLLDLSRIEAGVLQPVMRPLSLEEILPSALRSIDDASRITLALDESLPDFVADPALLDRVLANVIGNAVAWSPANANITLQAFERDNSVHLHVIDNGVGIPELEKAKVLQPFHRLGDSSHSGGLGLGLAIADRLIAAMNGRLELRDTPGGGLTVVIILPNAETSP